MKVLLLFLTLFITIFETFGGNPYLRLFGTCEDWPHTFVDNETHQTYKAFNIFKTNRWKFKIYDGNFYYLDKTAKMDVFGLIKINFKIFSPRGKYFAERVRIFERYIWGVLEQNFSFWKQHICR